MSSFYNQTPNGIGFVVIRGEEVPSSAMEKRVRFFADEVEKATNDMEKLVVTFADEVEMTELEMEGLENEMNKTAYAVENAAYQADRFPYEVDAMPPYEAGVDTMPPYEAGVDTIPPYEAGVDTMPNEVKKDTNKVDKTGNKVFKPKKNWDRLLKRMEKGQKDDTDVVKTANQVLKPMTNWQRILKKWDRNNKKIDPKLLKNKNAEKFISVTLCQAEEHILENGEEEEEFLSAVEKGDINTFMEMLEKKEQIWLNIECTDSNGMSALRIAISQGYSVIVEQLLLQGVYIGDALLRAVDIGLPDTVKILCEFAEKMPTKEERYAVMECHCDNDDFHQDVTPIVLAAQRNDFTVVKILLDYGVRIPHPHVGKPTKEEAESTSQVDTLLKSVGTLEVYKALSADAYVSQAYLDPVDRSFELSAILQKLSRTDVEFKHTYLELAENVDEIGRDVISHARNTEEIMTVLTHHEKKKESKMEVEHEETDKNIGPLPKLSRAIAFQQKHFVAHPNCQQAILAKFYGRLAYLRDRSPMYRRLLFLAVVLCFPFISLAYLYVPTTWVKNNIGCPYTKFMLQMSSDMIFVFLLTCDTFLLEGVYTIFTLLRPTKVLLLLWIIGITWREVKAYRRRGLDIFGQGKHIRDCGLAFLFIVGVVFDITHYQYVLNNPYTNGTNVSTSPVPRLERRALLENFWPFTSPTPPLHNITGTRYNDTNDEEMMLEITKNISNGAIYVHRVANIPLSRARGGKGPNVNLKALGEGERGDAVVVTDPDFLGYLAHAWYHPRLIATAFFAVSTVISFLRMLPYVVVSDVIGPLQISLGTMITETAHFFLVVGVVVVSFAIGLTYIYSYYEETQWAQCLHANEGLEEGCSRGTLPNLFRAVIYLYWSVFGLETMDPLRLNNQAWVIQAAGITLYAMFYVLVVVVLLNALIAVMSNVYNEVEENGDIEWKFASTVLWMDVLMDDDVVAPPFNLLPSKDALEVTWQRILKACRHIRAKNVVNHNGCKYSGPSKTNKRNGKNGKNGKSKKHQRSQYQRVMARLVERYVAAKTAGEVSVEAEVGIADIRALRNDLLSLKFEMYNKLVETNDDIGNTINYGLSVHHKCKETDGLYDYTEEVRGHILSHDDFLAEMNNIFKENYSKVPPSRPPSPPPPPPKMEDVGVNTDPPPPPPPPRAPPPPPMLRNTHSQVTPPPTPPPSPTFEDLYTQVTPPPSPPVMVDSSTEIDAAVIPQDIGTMVRRFERKRANSLVPPNSFRPPIVEHKDPWRPFGKPKSRPQSPERRNSTGAKSSTRSPRISPSELARSLGHGRTTPTRSPAISPESIRKKFGSSTSRSSSISSGSLSPDSIRKVMSPSSRRSPGYRSSPSSGSSSKKSSPAGSFDETSPSTTKPRTTKPRVSSQLTNPTRSSAGKSSTPPKPGSNPTKTGTTPTRTGSTPTRTGTTPPKTGTTPPKTGTTPTKTGTNPTKTGTNPTKTGTNPTKTGTNPTKPGTHPTKTGSNQTRTSTNSTRTGTNPSKTTTKPVTTPTKSGTNATKPGTKTSNPSSKTSNPTKTGNPSRLKTRPAAPSHRPKSPNPSGRL